MARRPYKALALLLVVASTPIRADPPAQAPREIPIASLSVFVRHRRAARIVLSVGMAGGFACSATSLALLYRDGAALAAGTGTAAAVRRDVLAFCASTVLLSFSAVAFDALRPEESAPSRE
jgi:hypothetical protein